jgi:DNA replication protein DnaC
LVQILDPLILADFLVLDDLGSVTRQLQKRIAAVYAEDIITLLYRLFDERLIRRRSTVVTTNLRKEDLYAQFGEQVVSRLRGLCKGAAMDGLDYRTGERR